MITKRGKPVAELSQARELRKPIFGSMRGSVKYMGDIISPIDVEWDAIESLGVKRSRNDSLSKGANR